MKDGIIYDMEVNGLRVPSFKVYVCLNGKVHITRSRVVFATVDEFWRFESVCDSESCRLVGEGPVHESRLLIVPSVVLDALLKLDINKTEKGTLLFNEERSREVFLNGPEGTNRNRRWIQNI